MSGMLMAIANSRIQTRRGNVNLRMSGKQSLKILNILGAAGDCFHHQQILNTRQSYSHTTDVVIFAVGNSRTLERQFAECDVDVDPGSRMPHEQYAASLRKLQCVFHADEPIAHARPGSPPRDLVPAQRHGAKPLATQVAEAWFPSAYASVPSLRRLAPVPNVCNRQELLRA